jgi:hypothetical protein
LLFKFVRFTEPFDVNPRPAFSSRTKAGIYIAAVLGFCFLPVLTFHTHLFTPRSAFERLISQDSHFSNGAFPFITHQIFDETSEIDILFLGNSSLWHGVRARIVQKALSEKVGREANVMTFGVNWPGRDFPFVLLRQVLARRKVKSLVLCMDENVDNENTPHVSAHHWLRYGEYDEAFAGLSPWLRLKIFAAQVLGTPGNVLSAISPREQAKDLYRREKGSFILERGFNGSPFFSFQPRQVAFTAEETTVTSGAKSDKVTFEPKPIAPYQANFIHEMAQLAEGRGVPVTVLHLPFFENRSSPQMRESEGWVAQFSQRPEIIGLPERKLFGALSEEEIRLLFYDAHHLNANGANFFTKTITPALVASWRRSNPS